MTARGPATSAVDDVTHPLVQVSLVDLAVGELRRLVFAGVYQPGEHLVEERLTEQLGISRPPLREALRILGEQGLLEQTPRRGVRVTVLSAKDMAEIYSLRTALERLAVELSFPAPGPSSLVPIERALDDMWSAARRDDAAGVIETNCRFHVHLVDLAKHERLTRSYRSLMQQMQLSMSVNLRTEAGISGGLLEGCRRHERLLAVLRTGVAEAVLAELAAHGNRTYLDGTRAEMAPAPKAPTGAAP